MRLAAAQKREAKLPSGDASGGGAARAAAKAAEDASRRVADAAAAVEEAAEALREAKRKVSLATTTSTLKRLINAFTALQEAALSSPPQKDLSLGPINTSFQTGGSRLGTSPQSASEQELYIGLPPPPPPPQQQQQQTQLSANPPAPVDSGANGALPQLVKPTQPQSSQVELTQKQQTPAKRSQLTEDQLGQSASAFQSKDSPEQHPHPTMQAEPRTQQQTEPPIVRELQRQASSQRPLVSLAVWYALYNRLPTADMCAEGWSEAQWGCPKHRGTQCSTMQTVMSISSELTVATT